jgi:hypothetical protein
MSSHDQAAGLIASAKKRHDNARRQAVSALKRLDAVGAPINMSTVARAAGVSRAWLYRQSDLRTMIEHLRYTPGLTPAAALPPLHNAPPSTPSASSSTPCEPATPSSKPRTDSSETHSPASSDSAAPIHPPTSDTRARQ